MKKIVPVMFAVLLFCTFGVTAEAAQTEETTEETGNTEETGLNFQIESFSYEILPDATQEDMPPGFTISDWEYHGIPVKAGKTENSEMICVMAKDLDTNSEYRFIYDPNHELFVPYFGIEIKNGYVYTIPVYEGAEVPYGFVESYFVIQTVPMTTYMRSDGELTQEEIAVGSLSEDNYLVFLMMNEEGEEIHYTYDLIDRTFQRALLQREDAEKVTELNEVIDKLHTEIGKLNENNAERMNKRLAIVGVLAALVIIMAGVIINLLIKISGLKREKDSADEWEEDEWEEEESYEEESYGDEVNEETYESENPVKEYEAERVLKEPRTAEETDPEEDEEIQILDLDEEDL